MEESIDKEKEKEAKEAEVELDDLINKYIDEFVEKHLDSEFQFRKGQRTAIFSICKTFMDKDKKHYFLQAPTGAGKSIIAIIVSYVLNQIGYKGYILTSDLGLQDQYENDFKRFHLNWGSVKGLDNYVCLSNGETHRYGNCHMRMETLEKIKARTCYEQCPYYLARRRALASDTSLLNYSYWLSQDFREGSRSLFTKRDFIICDEAHKLADIIQNAYAPKIDKFTKANIKILIEGFQNEISFYELEFSEVNDILDQLLSETSNEKLFEILILFCEQLGTLSNAANQFKSHCAKMGDGKIPNYLKKHIRLCNWLAETQSLFNTYVSIISGVGTKYMIPCRSDGEISFKTLNERFLMEKYFHDKHNFSVFMSATMGTPKMFYKNIAGEKVNPGRSCSIPSTFNFEKSPICVYPGHSMSYKQKDKSLPWIAKKVEEILEAHKGEKGIIHCGSYSNGERILNLMNDTSRIITYKPGDKSFSLCEFEDSNDKVLMGPSILEGINLENDKSRFQIFVKVPYASLSDDFISAKLRLDPSWYQNDAIVKMLQGVGRSVRNEKDWAVTYILDSDFIYLWKKNIEKFPEKEFNDRLKFIYGAK